MFVWVFNDVEIIPYTYVIIQLELIFKVAGGIQFVTSMGFFYHQTGRELI